MVDIISEMMPPGSNMGGDRDGDQDESEKRKRSNPLKDQVEKRVKKKATRFATRMAMRLAVRAGSMVARAAVSNPVGITVIAVCIVLFLIIFLFFFMFGGGGGSSEPEPIPPSSGGSFPPIPGFSLTLTGPESVNNGESIRYTISYSYNESQGRIPLEDISIYDQIPNNVTLTDASGSYQQIQGSVVWNLGEPENTSPLTITFTPQQEDILVTNRVYAQALSGAIAGGGGTGTNTPPTQDNCNGAYQLNNPLGNFGDPSCDFNKDDLYNLLQSLDPDYTALWYYKIIPCESSYNPNTWADPIVVGTPDPVGAWGLFQMGRGRNGEYDHGDVVWRLQVGNAVNYYYKVMVPAGVSSHGAYWQCAR